MLSKDDIQRIADINSTILAEGDDCELEIEDINWLIEIVLSFDVMLTEVQNDNQRLKNAMDVLLGTISALQGKVIQKEKRKNVKLNTNT